MDHSEEAKRNSNREHEIEIYTQKEEFAHFIHEQKNEDVAHKVDVKECESVEHSKSEQPNHQENEDKAIKENHLEKASNNQQNTENAYRHKKMNYSSQYNITETQEQEERKADTIYIVQQENPEDKAEEHLSREKPKNSAHETADSKQVHENETANSILQEKPEDYQEIHEDHDLQELT